MNADSIHNVLIRDRSQPSEARDVDRPLLPESNAIEAIAGEEPMFPQMDDGLLRILAPSQQPVPSGEIDRLEVAAFARDVATTGLARRPARRRVWQAIFGVSQQRPPWRGLRAELRAAGNGLRIQIKERWRSVRDRFSFDPHIAQARQTRDAVAGVRFVKEQMAEITSANPPANREARNLCARFVRLRKQQVTNQRHDASPEQIRAWQEDLLAARECVVHMQNAARELDNSEQLSSSQLAAGVREANGEVAQYTAEIAATARDIGELADLVTQRVEEAHRQLVIRPHELNADRLPPATARRLLAYARTNHQPHLVEPRSPKEWGRLALELVGIMSFKRAHDDQRTIRQANADIMNTFRSLDQAEGPARLLAGCVELHRSREKGDARVRQFSNVAEGTINCLSTATGIAAMCGVGPGVAATLNNTSYSAMGGGFLPAISTGFAMNLRNSSRMNQVCDLYDGWTRLKEQPTTNRQELFRNPQLQKLAPDAMKAPDRQGTPLSGEERDQLLDLVENQLMTRLPYLTANETIQQLARECRELGEENRPPAPLEFEVNSQQPPKFPETPTSNTLRELGVNDRELSNIYYSGSVDAATSRLLKALRLEQCQPYRPPVPPPEHIEFELVYE